VRRLYINDQKAQRFDRKNIVMAPLMELESFNHSLAKEGFNIILISRTKIKLIECQRELDSFFPNVQSEMIEFDISQLVTLKDYNE
jgi:hypothetical protein